MSGIQKELFFMNKTSIIGNNNTLTRGDVDYKANAVTNKDTWGSNQNAQIGGMYFIATVTTGLTAATSATISLTHNTSNTLVSGTAIANLSIPANSAVGYTTQTQLPKGTTRGTYLGVVVIGSGNIAAGNVTAYLSPHSKQIID